MWRIKLEFEFNYLRSTEQVTQSCFGVFKFLFGSFLLFPINLWFIGMSLVNKTMVPCHCKTIIMKLKYVEHDWDKMAPSDRRAWNLFIALPGKMHQLGDGQ